MYPYRPTGVVYFSSVGGGFLRSPERILKMAMLPPLSDGVWAVLFRGVVIGFLGGFLLILLFLWSSGKYRALVVATPTGFLYFLIGLEIGVALIGAIVFLGFSALHGWGQRTLDQSRHGGT
jgi:hypothetical protein